MVTTNSRFGGIDQRQCFNADHNPTSGCQGDQPVRHASRLSDVDCKSVQPEPVKSRRAFPTHIVLVQIITRRLVAMVTGRNQSGHLSTRNGNRHHPWSSNGHFGIDESHCVHPPPGAGDDWLPWLPPVPARHQKRDYCTHPTMLPTRAQIHRATVAFDSAALRVACIVLLRQICCFAEPASIILGFASSKLRPKTLCCTMSSFLALCSSLR